uniref:Poly [ADP-ribose] polymerase 12 n=1 Tax=Sarcophilus harrisii TaxID=9305 RepID=A0A7N4UXI7_SARHA
MCVCTASALCPAWEPAFCGKGRAGWALGGGAANGAPRLHARGCRERSGLRGRGRGSALRLQFRFIRKRKKERTRTRPGPRAGSGSSAIGSRPSSPTEIPARALPSPFWSRSARGEAFAFPFHGGGEPAPADSRSRAADHGGARGQLLPHQAPVREQGGLLGRAAFEPEDRLVPGAAGQDAAGDRARALPAGAGRGPRRGRGRGRGRDPLAPLRPLPAGRVRRLRAAPPLQAIRAGQVQVCPYYNRGEGPHGSCNLQDNCTKLHICKHFIWGECRFQKCKRSHNLHAENVMKLLREQGLNSSAILNIQRICKYKHSEICKSFDKKKADKRSEAAFINKKTKSDEICLYYIWKFCKRKNNCKNIHYHLPYRWQKLDGTVWNDLPMMEGIEKLYCNPKNSRCVSSAPSPSYFSYISLLFNSGLGVPPPSPNVGVQMGDLAINFETMTSGLSPVRRLSTPSSVTKPASMVLTTTWIWYWVNDNGQWTEYGTQGESYPVSSITSVDIETVFLADSYSTIDFRAGHQYYEINFKEMFQRNLTSQTKRKVCRRPKFVSPEDVEKLRKGNQGEGSQQSAFTFAIPPSWDKLAVPDIGYKLVAVDENSKEFSDVKNQFEKTMTGFIIQRILRIQNLALWQVFQWQKEQMKKMNGGKDVDERRLFHGTKYIHLNDICSHNFDWRICGTHATVYGKGSYFARDASYSHNYSESETNVKIMFLARVLVGVFTQGDSKYVRPPMRQGTKNTFYDSCVNNRLDPTIFVIFEKHQIYPEYVIEYTEKSKQCIIS